jgi:putative membrane protein
MPPVAPPSPSADTRHHDADSATTLSPAPVPIPFAIFSGFLMGAADAVPGVSGGTIALILGIYRRFIDALSRFVRAPFAVRDAAGRADLIAALWLLVPLGLGLAPGYLLTSKFLVGKGDEVGFLQDPTTAMYGYGFFFGLVVFSLREPWRRIRRSGPDRYVAAAATAVAAFVVTGLPYATQDPPAWMLPFGGAAAISVMLLPGVSGSLLLLTIGQYQMVTTAVHDRDLVLVALFGGGILIGLATFVPLLRRLLKTHHDLTMAALTGLMAGSLRALWPWKSNYDSKKDVMANVGIDQETLVGVLLAAALGAVVIFVLAWIERRMLPEERAGSQT